MGGWIDEERHFILKSPGLGGWHLDNRRAADGLGDVLEHQARASVTGSGEIAPTGDLNNAHERYCSE